MRVPANSIKIASSAKADDKLRVSGMVENTSQSAPEDPQAQKRKKKVNRAARGEGSLYLRGKMWWYKAPDGICRSIGTWRYSNKARFTRSEI
jgi:hypothetical protein